MKEAAVVACLLAELCLAAFVLASEGAARCPASIYAEATTVDCNDLGLLALPQGLPSETQVLLLQTNNIVNVEKSLDYLANITEIDLSQNNISSVSDSLPNLREVSLHSNPIRCDCVIRWVNTNRTTIRFMEPDSLFCVEPPEYQGQHVRKVHFREMTEICLPLISPGSLPDRVEISKESSVSLHCRATNLGAVMNRRHAQTDRRHLSAGLSHRSTEFQRLGQGF
uniref:LRRCT domain-containing protein n=1 Tax=Neolamprologus brichardi TaxID=32507 RepID=A0A3Q4HNC2_NEOBR